jgi:hypothetical protein
MWRNGLCMVGVVFNSGSNCRRNSVFVRDDRRYSSNHQIPRKFKLRHYRFFFGRGGSGGGMTGLLLMAITSCMMECIRILASAGRFLAGFFIPLIYHAKRHEKKLFFKVAHYPGFSWVDFHRPTT